MDTMQALYTTSPGNYGLTALPLPVSEANEALVRVVAAGLCPNELRLKKGLLSARYPIVPGHQQ